jgi:hypothetical protein
LCFNEYYDINKINSESNKIIYEKNRWIKEKYQKYKIFIPLEYSSNKIVKISKSKYAEIRR